MTTLRVQNQIHTLPEGENSFHIDSEKVESLPLGLVDGDCPGEDEGNLNPTSFNVTHESYAIKKHGDA